MQYTCSGNTRRRRKRKRNIKNIWSNSDWEFHQFNVGHQITDPGIQRTTSNRIKPQNFQLGISYLNWRKSHIKKKSWKKSEEKDNYIQLLLRNQAREKRVEWIKCWETKTLYSGKWSFKNEWKNKDSCVFRHYV